MILRRSNALGTYNALGAFYTEVLRSHVCRFNSPISDMITWENVKNLLNQLEPLCKYQTLKMIQPIREDKVGSHR